MEKINISVDNAKPNKLHYVVANFVIVNKEDKTVLLTQRGEDEAVYAGKWEFPGGKSEHELIEGMIEKEGVDPLTGIEDFLGKLATKETEEEVGLTVKSRSEVMITNKMFIRPDGIPVFMVTLLAEYVGGEVVLEKGMGGFAWITADQLDDYDCIPGIQDEARKALSLI